MFGSGGLSLIAFLMVGSLVPLLIMLLSRRQNRLDARLKDLSGPASRAPEPDTIARLARTALPKMGVPLIPSNEEERTKLRTRLIQAGLYSNQAMVVFLGVKMLLMVPPAIIGLAAGLSGLIPISHGLIFGAFCGIFGMIAPSFWLDRKKAERQGTFRRSLPDALDL